MGFPVNYASVLAKLIVAAITSITVVKHLALLLLESLGLSADTVIAGVEYELWQSYAEIEAEFNTSVGCESAICSNTEFILERIPTRLFREIIEQQAEELCAVCLCELVGCQQVRQLPYCAHLFHKDCIDRWVSRDRRTCPLCRSSLVSEEIIGVELRRLESDRPNELLW